MLLVAHALQKLYRVLVVARCIAGNTGLRRLVFSRRSPGFSAIGSYIRHWLPRSLILSGLRFTFTTLLNRLVFNGLSIRRNGQVRRYSRPSQKLDLANGVMLRPDARQWQASILFSSCSIVMR